MEERSYRSSTRPSDTRRARQQARQKKHRRMKVLATLCGFCLLICSLAIVLFVRTADLKNQMNQYQAQIEQLESDIQQEVQKTEQLQNELERVTSDEYIEAEARKRLGYVYENEILLQPSN